MQITVSPALGEFACTRLKCLSGAQASQWAAIAVFRMTARGFALFVYHSSTPVPDHVVETRNFPMLALQISNEGLIYVYTCLLREDLPI